MTPTVLYACSTWGLTEKLEKKFAVARRKMLRFVFRVHRLRFGDDPEDWVEYLRRSKQRVTELSVRFWMHDWVDTNRRRKWRFAGSLARQTDGRWSQLVLDWKPNQGHGRCRGHPHTRWSDALEKFAGGTGAKLH